MTSKSNRMKAKNNIFLLIIILLNGCSSIGHMEWQPNIKIINLAKISALNYAQPGKNYS